MKYMLYEIINAAYLDLKTKKTSNSSQIGNTFTLLRLVDWFCNILYTSL